MSVVHITPPNDLKPKSKFFDDVGDVCINIDGCIEMAKRADTPQARLIYRKFRKEYALLRAGNSELTPEKMREEAFFAALRSIGYRTSFTHISGSFS